MKKEGKKERRKEDRKEKRADVIAVISPPKKLKGEVTVPGDKSISHRAVILSGLARGTSRLENFLMAEDCMRTVGCMRAMGVGIEISEDGNLEIRGKGMKLKSPSGMLDAGNSGTTARLMLGVLSGQTFWSRIKGDDSLNRRPMLRVVEPLREMGAFIQGRDSGDKLPLRIKGGLLNPLDYQMKVASAQVKSSLLLAALFANGQTRIHEFASTRDHTELMMQYTGISLEAEGNTVKLNGPVSPAPMELRIAGDFSSAFFLAVAASIVPGSEVLIKEVGVNYTRTGALEVLQRMGASVELLDARSYGNEPVADLLVKGEGDLRGVTVRGEEIPRMIDEIPALCVAALAAKGKTVIEGAEELRVKETDRIAAVVQELGKFGAAVKERPDGIEIEGGVPLTGSRCHSHGDHRMAMALAVTGLISSGETGVEDFDVVKISFPDFMQTLRQLIEK